MSISPCHVASCDPVHVHAQMPAGRGGCLMVHRAHATDVTSSQRDAPGSEFLFLLAGRLAPRAGEDVHNGRPAVPTSPSTCACLLHVCVQLLVAGFSTCACLLCCRTGVDVAPAANHFDGGSYRVAVHELVQYIYCTYSSSIPQPSRPANRAVEGA